MDNLQLNHKEKFVLDVLDHKKNGFYVELGGAHSSEDSSTYNLETYYDWKGFSIEIVPERQKEYSENRKNPCVLGDAITYNYREYFEKNDVPKQIDFMSVNIDPGYNNKTGRMDGNPAQSLLGLIALPLSTYRFTIIMFEHDGVAHYKNNSMRDAQREILDALGYSLVVRGWADDIWIDPNVIPYSEYKKFYNLMGS